MKNIWLKFLCIFTFILSFVPGVFASGDLNISSVTFDNSSSFMSINSFDNEEFSFSAQPKLYIIEEEQKVYFDLNSSVLRCPPQDMLLSSADIKQVLVKQFSVNPNIVRVVIYYNQGFNPHNIQLRKLNNTLFVRFKQPQIQNYYFQHIYTDAASSVNGFYEPITIQTPVSAVQNDLISQINSAFKLGTTEDENYILSKKDLVLPTNYYVDNVNIKNNVIHINGNGSLTITKPIHLSNPTRTVFDIPNAYVNPSIRNKDVYINQSDTVKVGQFDRTTARIVIKSPNAPNYVPIIYGDTQHLVLIDKVNGNIHGLYSSMSALTSTYEEVSDIKTNSIKIIFSKPVIYGIERSTSNLDLYFFNVDKYQDINPKSSLALAGIKFAALKNGGIKLTVPAAGSDSIDIHAGVDGKTIRIKQKIDKPVMEVITPAEPVQVTVPKVSGKKFVVVDPGHGGSDVGATRNGIYEKNITLDISERVADLLRKKGYEVYMTRDADKTVSLKERVEYCENVDPDVFVSVHVNSSNIDSPNGMETHYYKDNSLQLAKTVHASLLNHVKAHDRGLFKSKFYVINHTTAPAILIEVGFISNPSERAQLVSDSRKQSTAKAIAEGIDEYLK